MTEAICLECLELAEKAETANKARRQVSVSGMLKYLGVSRFGYCAWMKRVLSNTAKRREAVKAHIKDIYEASKQNSVVNYKISLMSNSIQNVRTPFGVLISPIFDNRRICLSYQHYGLIFQKNHCVGTFKKFGSILRD